MHGVGAGVLRELDTEPRYEFCYYADYVNAGGMPVCLAMPLQKDPYVSDVLFPFFFNMLSEGENRMMQSSVCHIDKEDSFGIMLATAQYDTVGAVTVRPL